MLETDRIEDGAGEDAKMVMDSRWMCIVQDVSRMAKAE